jgi:hypothetical protein
MAKFGSKTQGRAEEGCLLMEDKEVGELWRTREQHQRMTGCTCRTDLIRKLCEERAAVYDNGDRSNDDQHKSCVERALRDFGIDPEEFKKGKGNDPKGQTMNDHS